MRLAPVMAAAYGSRLTELDHQVASRIALLALGLL